MDCKLSTRAVINAGAIASILSLSFFTLSSHADDSVATVPESETTVEVTALDVEPNIEETTKTQTLATVDVEQVKNITLAFSDANGKPIKLVTSHIKANQETFELFAFVKLNNYPNETLTHRWKWGERVISEVSVSVNSPNHLTWSSRRILWRWQGNWSLEILNADGQVLETKTFRYGT